MTGKSGIMQKVVTSCWQWHL